MIQRVHAPGEVDERLQTMVRAIVSGVQPSRVILFGSRARGDSRPDSDYDLVVEFEFEPPAYWDAYARVQHALRHARDGCSVDILIRRPGEIDARRDDPGYMDWEIARDGTIIYPYESDDQLLRPRLRGAVFEDEPFPSIADWLARAQEDRLAIDALLASPSTSWSAIAFHAQQLAEKHLKVLFIQQHARPPRSHELGLLIRELTAFGHDLSDLLADATFLEQFAVDIRYPGDAAIPDETTARQAVDAAKRIVDAARIVFNQ